MRALRVAALAGSVHGQRVVPFAHIEDLAIARAAGLGKILAAGGVHGFSVAGTGKGSQVPLACGGKLIKGMAESHQMQFSPGPLFWIFALAADELVPGDRKSTRLNSSHI